MFVKCPIIKSTLVDTCGRESCVEQPLHWTLIHYARKELIKIKHAPIAIQVSKPSIHDDSIINK
jgi:hypothetical protein